MKHLESERQVALLKLVNENENLKDVGELFSSLVDNLQESKQKSQPQDEEELSEEQQLSQNGEYGSMEDDDEH